MNAQKLASRPTRLDRRYTAESAPALPGDTATPDSAGAPTPLIPSSVAREHATWMVPQGDGWADVYGDGDGWPVWEGESWTPLVGYRGVWAVPDGDGWAPYMPDEG